MIVSFLRLSLTIALLINVYLGHWWAVFGALLAITIFIEMVGTELMRMAKFQVLLMEKLDALRELMEQKQRETGR